MKQGARIQSFKSKKGNAVEFRTPSESEFAAVWGYACDIAAEDTYIALNKAPSEQEERSWFTDMLTRLERGDTIRISVYVNGVYGGNGRVDRGNYRHTHVGSVGLSLAPAFRDEGIGSVLMKALIRESKTLGLRLLTLSCFENNPRALHMYEKLGFTRSGVTPGAIAYQGSFVGEVQFYLPLTDV